jgi:hypothetical protein
MRAHIQADLVSIMDRPHSSRTGRPHRAPSFKWIGSASSCRALNHTHGRRALNHTHGRRALIQVISSRLEAHARIQRIWPTRLPARPQSRLPVSTRQTAPSIKQSGLRLMPPRHPRALIQAVQAAPHQRPHSSHSGLRSSPRSL